ncbi:hypothetical protein C475_14853 [Halosimplex carlsbadense 2-9-1]|uniref:Lipoprotein n=1 Tax=Halosimplex carlsbadense 2-9-1 TaxID=797114 RepID=M0CJV7_9EURY|nr:hypothetical protein [Halosimplex carlsbadense]ELZ23560.1 hypothetical protein C475_14853 [Halosimplex carlsbadense 2-9-1]
MTFRRRDILRIGGFGAVLAIGGCVYNGPFSEARLSLSVREEFGASAPVTVPLTVEASVQSVDTKVASLRGVEVVGLDADGSVLASHALDDLTYRGAPASQRTSRETEVGLGSTVTAYRAEWSFEPTLRTDAVPAALTFSATGLSLGRDDTTTGTVGSETPPSLVAPAAASRPPPPLRVDALRRRGGTPSVRTVGPDAYVGHRLEPRVSALDGAPLVPPKPTATATPTDRRDGSDAVGTEGRPTKGLRTAAEIDPDEDGSTPAE